MGRRVVFSGLAFFAMLGFVSVPLGNKSGWEHLKAIGESPAAMQAKDELKTSLLAAEARLSTWVTSWARREVSSGLSPDAIAHPEQPDPPVRQRHRDSPHSESLPNAQPPQLTP